jgi:hypothetical protein
MEQLCSHWMDFHEIWYLKLFWKCAKKINFHYNLTRITGTLHERLRTFVIISRLFLLTIRYVSDKSCRENQNPRFIVNNFLPKSCRLWHNVEKYGTARQATDDNIIRRMRIACQITKATDTHSEYLILIAFRQQQWLRERASMLRL